MSYLYKCEGCGKILETYKEVFEIGQRMNTMDFCYDCFVKALQIPDGAYFGWAGIAKALLGSVKVK